MKPRTDKQLNDLITRIEDKCEGDTSELSGWLENGNVLGYLRGRTDKSIIEEWNKSTNVE